MLCDFGIVTLAPLGKFDVTSGKVILTDPCYKFDAEKVLPARNGKWSAMAVWGNGVIKDLEVYHEEFDNLPSVAKKLDFTCPVGSGQAGVFDADMYAQYQGGKYDQLNTFYGQACHLCDTEQRGGIVKGKRSCFGVVSSSGYGDGDYNMEGWFYEGQLVSVRIYFVGDEEEERCL